jgi:outer membrane translocation and assembly module TamA
VNLTNTFIGTGIGLAFETKFGLLNISYAVGKRDDVKFNIREASKIHFGYINYF